MHGGRQHVLEWIERGAIAPHNIRRALTVAGVTPQAGDWRRFLDRLLLGLGVLALTAGVIFFFAYNWHALDRLIKFGLVDATIIAALVFVWRLGLDSASGKVSLLAAAMLVGALFALIGQTYQTGADTFELFAAWALAILPWAIVGRFAPLWLLWLLLINLAAGFYYATMDWFFWFAFSPMNLVWVLFAINAAALCLWEGAAYRGVVWLRARWAARVPIGATACAATALAVAAIFADNANGWGAVVWLAWLAAVYAIYRRAVKDLFALTAGVLSAVVVTVAFLSEHILKRADGGAFLFIGLVVIALSAVGGWWLKGIAAEEVYE